ncbi:hypothetical protein CH361_10700 [Leptospira brenneri]|nr:hypothetical protein CH361_10700 [Leptospira brenneri]
MKNLHYIYRFLIENLFVSLSIFFLLIVFQSKGANLGLFELNHWRYVHLGDASENIKNAMFLAKGGKLNEYVTSNHMPGLYLYLSFFLSMLPKDFLSNSLSNGVFILVFSSFVTIFTIISLAFYSVRMIIKSERLIFFFKILFCFVLLNLFLTFNYFRVLSETYLPFLQLVYLSLFFYYLEDRKNRFAYLIGALYFVGLSVFVGLTNVFTDFLFFTFFSFFLFHKIKEIHIKHFIPAIILLVFVFLKSGNLNFHYWIVETNKAQGMGSGLSMLKTIINNSWYVPNNWYDIYSYGPIFDHQIIVLILGLISIYLYRAERLVTFFLFLCILVLPLDSWRIQEQGFQLISQTYKNDVNMGICFFFLLLIGKKQGFFLNRVFDLISNRIKFRIDKNIFRVVYLLLVLLFIMRILSYLTSFIEFERIVSPNHSEWISKNNLCEQKFNKSNANCNCLSIMHWDQDFFLLNDVKPCKMQFSSYSPHLNLDDFYYNNVKSSFLDHSAVFLLYRNDLYTDQSTLSPRLVNLFLSGECNVVQGDFLFLCKSKTSL